MNFKLLIAWLITIAASPSTGQGPLLVDSSVETAGNPIHKEGFKHVYGKQPTSLLVRPEEPVSLVSRLNQLEAKFREKIEDIGTKTNSKIQQQGKEIEILKTQLEEERKFSKQLGGRISQLEASTKSSTMENDQLLTRAKRPYRLLPPHIPIDIENKEGKRNQQFYGPATNCNELGLLGFTLNGYYLVKKTADSTKKGKIGIVYCQFYKHQGQKQITTSDLPTLVDSELEVRIMAELHGRIEEIKTQTRKNSKDQEEKITMIRVKERNLAQLLNKTREEIEVLKTTNRGQSNRIDQLEQKLTILQNTTLHPPSSPANIKVTTSEIRTLVDLVTSSDDNTPPSVEPNQKQDEDERLSSYNNKNHKNNSKAAS